MAENWDTVVSSSDYYFGVGRDSSETMAYKRALAALVESIAVHVSSDFTGLTENTVSGSDVNSLSRVQSYVKTYAQTSLTNVVKMVRGGKPDVSVLCYIRRSDLHQLYADRIERAKDLIVSAEHQLQNSRLDFALEFFYQAYSLIRSVQRPNEVRDEAGHVLMNWLPQRIEQVLSGIDVVCENREGDRVNLLFSYGGKPVNNLVFNYSDGRNEIKGCYATGGRGEMEMVEGYHPEFYYLNIEYEFRSLANGDSELASIFSVLPRKPFASAARKIAAKATLAPYVPPLSTPHLDPSSSLLTADTLRQAEVMARFITAIRNRRYTEAEHLCTPEGRLACHELLYYGRASIAGVPHVQFFHSPNGHTVARGLQMSFTFDRGTKKTFIEDVIVSISPENKISNIAFGLGEVTENDILCKYAPGWTDAMREQVMEFMENYKTAYCLKRLDYIRDIFADDAIIIVGNVARKVERPVSHDGHSVVFSDAGKDVITKNRYSKQQYLERLEKCFRQNEFINLRFSQAEARWLRYYKERDGKDIFAIELAQEYNSSRYSDRGFLFLMVDMTNPESPLIEVRTWQPNQVGLRDRYNEGDFYEE